MPGKIVEILVENGSEVKEGEAIIILEAMKMQNEIISHVNGKVTKISVRKNDTVMKDDLMIEIDRE
jgi:biotin carboxyl carrier protein